MPFLSKAGWTKSSIKKKKTIICSLPPVKTHLLFCKEVIFLFHFLKISFPLSFFFFLSNKCLVTSNQKLYYEVLENVGSFLYFYFFWTKSFTSQKPDSERKRFFFFLNCEKSKLEIEQRNTKNKNFRKKNWKKKHLLVCAYIYKYINMYVMYICIHNIHSWRAWTQWEPGEQQLSSTKK